MELIIISESKLKVMLTRADMENYHLDFDTPEYDNARTRRAIWRLFDDVKRRSGFDVTEDRVLVQIWPGGDGGCELYVSKMDAPAPRRITRRTAPPVHYAKCLYVFEELSAMLAVCRALHHSHYSRSSDAYAGDDGKWYLLLDGGETTDRLSDLSFIEEYGRKLGSALSQLALAEHARSIARGDAVARMASLA